MEVWAAPFPHRSALNSRSTSCWKALSVVHWKESQKKSKVGNFNISSKCEGHESKDVHLSPSASVSILQAVSHIVFLCLSEASIIFAVLNEPADERGGKERQLTEFKVKLRC